MATATEGEAAMPTEVPAEMPTEVPEAAMEGAAISTKVPAAAMERAALMGVMMKTTMMTYWIMSK